MAAGVLDPRDFPTWDEQQGVLAAIEEPEEQIEIELREGMCPSHPRPSMVSDLCHCTEEPAFLQGQTTSSLELSPIKVVRNPDGSMARAVDTQTALAKERRHTPCGSSKRHISRWTQGTPRFSTE